MTGHNFENLTNQKFSHLTVYGNCNNPADEKTIQFLNKKIEQISTLQGMQ
jgi:hypothetical protein